jgi:nitrous oxidase accessory protein NosD
MVATIVSLAAVIGLAIQPSTLMAQVQNSTAATPPAATPPAATPPAATPPAATSPAATSPAATSPAATSPAAAVTNPACGEVVQGNVNLTANLKCSGDGIIVGADSTNINLNGYSIIGPGQQSSKVGVVIPNNNNIMVMGPGVISGFQAGILATGSQNVQVKNIILKNNEIAVFTTGSTNTQVSDNIINNNNLGIASHSSKSVSIMSNLVNNNQLAGVTLVNSHKAILTANNIEGGQNGLFLDAQSSENTINMNNVLHNVIDLNNANGLAPNINVNSYSDNNCMLSNPSGLCMGR